MRLPSIDENSPWIWSKAKAEGYPEDTENSGKWLVFVDRERVDEVWKTIAIAVYKGELGSSSKVETAMDTPPDKQRVICVYTYDYTDREDVTRVREKLRELGINWKIGYKTNAATKARIYSEKGKKVCVYWE